MKKSILIALVLLLIVPAAHAATSIGSGYQCAGKTIKKGSSTVSASTAKSAINAKLTPAKAKLKKLQNTNGSVEAIAKQQGVVDGLQDSLAKLARCTKGKLDGYVDPFWTDIQSHFWKGNYLLQPYNINKESTLGFGNDGKTMSGFFQFEGLLAGPIALQGVLDFKADIRGVSPTFSAKSIFKSTTSEMGNMTFTYLQSGAFTIDIANVLPNGINITHVVITGQRTGDTISGLAELRGAGEVSVGTIEFSYAKDI